LGFDPGFHGRNSLGEASVEIVIERLSDNSANASPLL
jgi:hypothetical protein